MKTMKKIRLTNKEVAVIKRAGRELLGESVKIYLFGSRVDMSKKGGDIDIFIESDKDISLEERLNFLATLERDGIRRKVDLVVKTPFKKERTIFEAAKAEGVLL